MFLCDKDSSTGMLVKASTDQIDASVRKAAQELGDADLLRKLASIWDLLAQDAVYHKICLVTLYNRVKGFRRQQTSTDRTGAMVHGLAFAQVITHIEATCHSDDNVSPVFHMQDLCTLYANYLHSNGISTPVNTTVLKDRILEHLPYLVEGRQGKLTLLVMRDDLGLAIADACNNTYSNAICLTRAAEILRRELFSPA